MSPDRAIALRVAELYLGTPYLWGGDDPRGFDCSGLKVEALQAAGRIPRGSDFTAEGLRTRFPRIEHDEAQPGDLVFWLRGGRAVHVGMLFESRDFYIGAEGGGPWATDPQKALEEDAFIKIRPVASRGTAAERWFASPMYEDTLGLDGPVEGG